MSFLQRGKRSIPLLYAGVGIGLGLLFLATLAPEIQSLVPENDLWWMIPAVFHQIEGKSVGQILGFLLSPVPIGFGQPMLKMYLFLLTVWAELYTRHLVFISMLFHFGNSGLLYRVCRQMGLMPSVSFFSALVYFTLFVHFHAVLWPTAFQHLLAVFTLLALLSLYLSTEELSERKDPAARWIYGATFAVGILASLQRSLLIGPILFLTHILFCSKDASQRKARYDRWLPLFVAFSLYPIFSLALVGDVIVNDALVELPLPGAWKFLLLFVGTLGILKGIRALLAISPMADRLRKGARFGIGFSVVVLLALLCLQDKRQLFLPYNGLVPFATALASFLDPIRTALSIDSTEAYHFLPPQVSFFGLLLSLGMIGLFLKEGVSRNRLLILWLVWYTVALIHLLHQYSSFPVFTPSRYFIYVTPVFSVLTGFGLITGVDLLFQGRASPWARHLLLMGLLVSLAVPNLLAIKLEIFRGRLANTLLLYDHVRAACLIKKDLAKVAEGDNFSPGLLYVSNVLPMPLDRLDKGFPKVDPAQQDNFRWVMSEVFQNRSLREIRVNPPGADLGDGPRYILEEDRITDGEGRGIDLFSERFHEGIFQMTQNHPDEAIRAFEEALRIRPFLFQYLLPSSGRLEDLRWMTNDLDLRDWIRRVGAPAVWGEKPPPKQEAILSLLHKELSDAILCFFFLSYVKHRQGDLEGSQRTLSHLWFLERNPKALISWIGAHPVVEADPAMGLFLQRVEDPLFFRNPLPWRMDDFGFGRFLMRLVFHWDFRSSWDERFGAWA